MNSTVDRMLGLTADIAEELLRIKDAECDSLPDNLKIKIISLAELAASVTTENDKAVIEESPDDNEATEMTETEPEPESEANNESESEHFEVTETLSSETERQESDIAVNESKFIEIQQQFSINDAFLFRREIFGGSRERFTNSLKNIAGLTDRNSLKTYLEEELRLTLERTPGKDFYRILAPLF